MHAQVWKGVTELQDWHTFPQWRSKNLFKLYPALGSDGIDLLQSLLQYQPNQRISVSALCTILQWSAF
jgi:hypothetical protein